MDSFARMTSSSLRKRCSGHGRSLSSARRGFSRRKQFLVRTTTRTATTTTNKTVVILSLWVTWEIDIRSHLRHREILHARKRLDGANTKSIVAPAVKVQEWSLQILTRLDKRGRHCYMSANRENVQHAETSIRYLVDHGRLVQVVSKSCERMFSLECPIQDANAPCVERQA